MFQCHNLMKIGGISHCLLINILLSNLIGIYIYILMTYANSIFFSSIQAILFFKSEFSIISALVMYSSYNLWLSLSPLLIGVPMKTYSRFSNLIWRALLSFITMWQFFSATSFDIRSSSFSLRMRFISYQQSWSILLMGTSTLLEVEVSSSVLTCENGLEPPFCCRGGNYPFLWKLGMSIGSPFVTLDNYSRRQAFSILRRSLSRVRLNNMESFSPICTTGLFLMFMVLVAQLRVDSVSSQQAADGDTHAIMSALAVPPSESMRSIVSLLSRYGMYGCLFFLSLRDLMTLPNVNRDLLMFPVSFAISPADLDSFKRSEPAKSTKENFPYRFYK